MEEKLNKNDNKLLAFCFNKHRSVGEVAKELNISPKNISVRLEKLSKLGLIKITKHGKGRKTFIRTTAGDKVAIHVVNFLKEIKKKGDMSQKEFDSLFPDFYSDYEELAENKQLDKLIAKSVLIIDGFVDRKFYITQKGKQFLKENENKNNN